MKCFALFLAILMIALPMTAPAAVAVATPVRVVYSSTNVGPSTWVALVGTTARSIKGFYIANTSTTALKLGIAPGSSIAGSEVAQLIIPGSAAATFVPLAVSAGQRLSVLSVSGTISSGELDATFLYY